MADALSGMEDKVRSHLVDVFARVTGRPRAEAEARYRGHTSLVMLLVKASAMCPPSSATPLTDLNALVLRTIDRTLDEIETTPRRAEKKTVAVLPCRDACCRIAGAPDPLRAESAAPAPAAAPASLPAITVSEAVIRPMREKVVGSGLVVPVERVQVHR